LSHVLLRRSSVSTFSRGSPLFCSSSDEHLLSYHLETPTQNYKQLNTELQMFLLQLRENSGCFCEEEEEEEDK